MDILSCTFGSRTLPQRYVLCFLTFVGIIIAYTIRVCIHITIIKMVYPVKQDNSCPGNATIIEVGGGTYNWTEKQIAIILSAFFPGYMLTHLPGGIASDLLGPKHILSISVLLPGIFTIFIPLMVKYGNWWCVVVIRFFVGFCQGAMFPSVSTLLAKWVPPRERSTLVSLVATGAQIGVMAGNLFSSVLMAYHGTWPIVFHFWGTIGIIWYIFFILFCYDEPAKHPFISSEEAQMLATEIGPTEKQPIPWRKILGAAPVWAIIFGEMGHDMIYFLIVVELPKYVADVLKFNMRINTILNTVPFCALWITTIMCGVLTDYTIFKHKVSIRRTRKLLTTFGNLVPVSCAVWASYFGCNRVAVAALLSTSVCTIGPFYSGLRSNLQDVTKNFAGVVMGLANGLGALAFIPIPSFVAFMTPHHTVEEWKVVLWILFVAVFVSTAIYAMCASAEREEWDSTVISSEPI